MDVDAEENSLQWLWEDDSDIATEAELQDLLDKARASIAQANSEKLMLPSDEPKRWVSVLGDIALINVLGSVAALHGVRDLTPGLSFRSRTSRKPKIPPMLQHWSAILMLRRPSQR